MNIMNIETVTAVLAIATLAGAGPSEAQERRDADWWRPAVVALAHAVVESADVRDREVPWWRLHRDEAYERRRTSRKGNGPPFCRNGAGHPVHGMDWCVRKGWAPEWYAHGWLRAPWTDAVFRTRAPGHDRRLREPTVIGVLGEIVFGRIVDHGRRLGHAGPVEARWFRGDVGSVLQIRMGGAPLAELTDANRDGRVDVVMLARR